MNQAIASIIKGKIEGLDFVDKIAGLVSVQSISVRDGEENITKTYPVACCTTADDCKSGAYNDLCPNSDYKTVIYFEDGGVSFERSESNWKYYTSALRLVCWINVAKILEDDCYSGDSCTLASHLITEIIRELPEFPRDETPFHRLYFEISDQAIRSNSIFSAYTYNEKQVQYLMYPYDYFALDIKASFGICMNSDVVPATPCDTIASQIIPIAEDASDIENDSFVANWEEESEAKGYIIDVSKDIDFSTFIIDGLEIGNVKDYNITGLDDANIYYYRIYAYDNNVISVASNIVETKTKAADYFLPPKDLLTEMRTILYVEGVGDFTEDKYYWSSSESAMDGAWGQYINDGTWGQLPKDDTYAVRACRLFTADVGAYELRDTGPAGGLIFYIDGTTYCEAAPSDQSISQSWSNISDIAIGTTGTAIGTGQANTTAIINQTGHTNSAAKLCNDLETC